MSSATKTYILKIKKDLDEFKQTNQTAKNYRNTLITISTRINELMADLQNLSEAYETDEAEAEAEAEVEAEVEAEAYLTEEDKKKHLMEKQTILNTINIELETLNNTFKETQNDYSHYIATNNQKYQIFKDRYPGLFEKFINNDMDNAVLLHCLDTFNLVQSGEITLENGKEMGYHKYHSSKK